MERGSGAAPLRVVVASHNPAKVVAVRDAFGASFPGAELNLVPTTADSGVAEQPMSDAETRQGALNRAHDARSRHPDADYWVGLEGGVALIGGELLAFAWMAVLDAPGRLGMARSATLPLPPEVRARVERGEELGSANDAVFGTVGSKQRGGAFGLLTGGRFTREGVYAETLCLALLPFVNPLYATSPNGTPAT
ncbi:MAG: inosine/xanthosine triphosphatase [Xanthomonadales bacterium]